MAPSVTRRLAGNFGGGALVALGLLACSQEGDADDVTGRGGAAGDTGAEGGSGGANGAGGPSATAGATGGGGAPSEERAEYPPLSCPDDERGFASELKAFSPGPGDDFGRDRLPGIVLGGPRGGGETGGSLDVVSLGDGGSITLGFGALRIVDGDGIDFVVFENAFRYGGDLIFSETGQVEVSPDGEQWFALACDPETGTGCAGWTPVLAHPDAGLEVALDPARSGGDGFDLADWGLEEVVAVRITDWPDDGSVFDLDAIAVVHGRCEPE